MLELMKERRGLYRTNPESNRVEKITEALKPIRKEVRMCSRIAVHSLEIERSLERMAHWEKENVKQKEETKDRQEKKER